MPGMARDAVLAAIGLGANLGPAEATLRAAREAIAHLPLTQFVSASSLYRSAPIGAGGPDYLNAVVLVRTAWTAPALLDELLRIEARFGRERPFPNAPRTLDLDLLRYGDGRITSPTLVVPHPRMGERAFVLRPLAELMPHWVAPAELAATAGQRIERLQDRAPL
ncbi:MAG: 2-amino-4-hydroxy-6-hydroxymethyldihydropteridine diphosphokinase [Pseudomonadota bacterium]